MIDASIDYQGVKNYIKTTTRVIDIKNIGTVAGERNPLYLDLLKLINYWTRHNN